MVNPFLNLISGASGLIIILIDLVFAVWAGFSKSWYFYPIYFVLLFAASSAINTSYIQGLTRGYSYIYLFRFKGVSKAIGVNILTMIILIIAYLITQFIFSDSIQIALFFVSCIALSTFVAFIDDHFRIAIERTKSLETIMKD